MTKTDQKNAAKSYNKEEVPDEFSSPEGENKKPKRKTSSRPATQKRSYNSKYKPKNSRVNYSSRREVSPSTEPPALNGSKSSEKKGWIKKIFS